MHPHQLCTGNVRSDVKDQKIKNTCSVVKRLGVANVKCWCHKELEFEIEGFALKLDRTSLFAGWWRPAIAMHLCYLHVAYQIAKRFFFSFSLFLKDCKLKKKTKYRNLQLQKNKG